MQERDDWDFGAGIILRRIEQAWIAWNLETTPGIFLAMTVVGCLVFGGVTFALAAVAYVGAGQTLGGPPPIPFEAICLPPAVVLIAWLAYRIRWYRIKFGILGEAQEPSARTR